ncbi:uncharacterized protein LOC132061087 [Lycium ferocissimum]|uniref:uncharacterized protein LOC132061087 n=1 Tax=Lycium ferocissimum TaxID=112874 RepID=UPI002815CA24|nr:uncharacterized protein LOC132061087 [Lycium ferocissimum]
MNVFDSLVIKGETVASSTKGEKYSTIKVSSSSSISNNFSKDIDWNFGRKGPTQHEVICNFCDKSSKGGIIRQKQHLLGIGTNSKACKRCPESVKAEIRAYMEQNNAVKTQMRFDTCVTDHMDDSDDDMDEVGEIRPRPSKTQKRKGPMNLYYPQKPKEGAGLPFTCVNDKSFKKVIDYKGEYGPNMKPPTYHEVRVTYLKKEVQKVDDIVEEHKVQWSKFGCPNMMDKWSAWNRKMVINVLRTIESIGKDNVIQVVTDNASENVKAGHMMQGSFPHIYWTPCTAHCINLIFRDIFKINQYASVFSKTTKIYAYISQRPLLLNLMRKFTNERNLFLHAKEKLKKLVTSNEWKQSKHAKEITGKEVARNLISPSFWDDVCKALKVGSPLIIVLRLVDGKKKPPKGYLYEAMDLCKESIAKAFGADERKYDKNAAVETLDGEVWDDYISCLEKLVPDPRLRDRMSIELGKYKRVDGTFGKESAITARDRLSLVEWWLQYGNHVPVLQKFAVKVLSLTCSASGCERNWSIYEHIHSKKRNRLELKCLNDLVYIKCNRRFKRRYKARDTIDPIRLENIEDVNEWVTGAPEDLAEEELEDGGLTWGIVASASGCEESIYGLRASCSMNKNKGVASSTSS